MLERLKIIVGTLLLTSIISMSAHAQSWPSKPLKIIVPWPPGGAADITARHLQNPLSEAIGQPVIIENKSGAGGIVGTEALVRSPADGHTIGMVISSHASNVSLYSKLPYDSMKDVKPLTIVTLSPNIMIVHPSSPYKTLTDIIEAAKAKPGDINVATSGNGTGQHFALEQIKILKNLDMVHVPYRGAGPALNDLVGGQVQVGILNIAGALPHIQAGRLRAIAVTTAKRAAIVPDVPTMAETLPEIDIPEYFATVAPAGVPDDVLQKLYEAVAKAARTPAMAEKVAEAGMELVLNPPADFRARLERDIARFADIVKKANMKIE